MNNEVIKVNHNKMINRFDNNESFEKISHVLSNEQIEVLKSMKDNLELHYNTGQVFRSEVEMKFSVLNDGKFPTHDAKYWQCVREQNVHFTNLVVLGYDYESTQVKIKNLSDMIKKHSLKKRRIQEKLDNKENDLSEIDREELLLEISLLNNKINTLKIEVDKQSFFQSDKKKVAYNRWREVVTWEKLMLELQPQMKYGVLSYEHHQPGSYERRMEHQYNTMVKSGAKASPSEAINITNQNVMIKKLQKSGIFDDKTRELPINRAVNKVMNSTNSNNYASLTEKSSDKDNRPEIYKIEKNIKEKDLTAEENEKFKTLEDVVKDHGMFEEK